MKICIATSTRADWGLLSPLAKELASRPGIVLQILATNMHLLDAYGHTSDEIVADGFEINAKVPIDSGDDSPMGRAEAMAQCLAGTARALQQLEPDMLVVLGDRYEMLAVASAAAMLGIPIAHIAGGEISEGAIDDSLRHAITKLSALHFTAADEYRQRVVQMGEDPERVINAGALGVWNVMRQPLLSAKELAQQLGFDFESKKLIIATFHPATLDTGASPADRCQAMLDALDRFPGYKVIATYPNNDAGGQQIIERLQAWAKWQPGRVLLIKSLGMRRYLSALQFASAVVGNSSSGIVEVPSMGVPTVDIGMRQQGRLAGPSVIHCGNSEAEIADAIAKALSPEWQQLAASRENPYFKPDTVKAIADKIAAATPADLKVKKFYDIPS